MKKRIIQTVVVVLFCVTLLIVAYNDQKGDEDIVHVSASNNTCMEPEDTVQPEQEEYMKDFTTFLDADCYNLVDDSCVSQVLIDSVDNYIRNEIETNSYSYVRIVGFWYNYDDCESNIELMFDKNKYRYIVVRDSYPDDIIIIYNYSMTDLQLEWLGLKED